MTAPTSPPPSRRAAALRAGGVIGLAVLVLGLATLGACGWNRGAPSPEPGPPEQPKDPVVGGLPLFHGWPKDAKPAAVVVLSGQTFGYVQPCGCSRPQMGGLERRAVFVKSLRDKGWPVVGADLGDVYPPKSAVEEQGKLKYRLAMDALREMGYVAVGVGKAEFPVPGGIDQVLGEYALQKEQPPFLLAGNLLGVAGGQPQAREDRFPKPPGAARPMVGLAEVADAGGTPVGVVGVIGKSTTEDIKKVDPSVTFDDNREVLKKAVAALDAHPKKPRLNVLLFQGTADEAKKVAADWPQFAVVLCQAEDPEPPQFPQAVDGPGGRKTLVVQVGHKGRYVGVVGAFAKPDGGFDLRYQLVPLGEEYVTAGPEEAARKANPVLPLFDAYAAAVRDRNFLGKVVKEPHPSQLQEDKLNISYVGSERCQGCHAGEHARWKGTAHSHALDALEKVAKRPTLRNFDGECVRCHVVGLNYRTGYEDQKTTPHLAHVGCESCHGPGSGHAADPRAANLLALQSPWKAKPGDRLPPVGKMKEIAALPAFERGRVALKPEEQRVINAVSAMCARCHDAENDPHFDIFTYWPKVDHAVPKK
ncbi:MAG: hypothetical protein C0501_19955 [Isosphaera sp.]|nr:hypothetical protein [Isosphaera sp.]